MLNAIKLFKPVAWVLGNWQLAIAGLGLSILVMAGAYVKGRVDGRDLTLSAMEKANTEASKLARTASEEATAIEEVGKETFQASEERIEGIVNDARNNGDDLIGAFFDGLRAEGESGTDKAPAE